MVVILGHCLTRRELPRRSHLPVCEHSATDHYLHRGQVNEHLIRSEEVAAQQEIFDSHCIVHDFEVGFEFVTSQLEKHVFCQSKRLYGLSIGGIQANLVRLQHSTSLDSYSIKSRKCQDRHSRTSVYQASQ